MTEEGRNKEGMEEEGRRTPPQAKAIDTKNLKSVQTWEIERDYHADHAISQKA